MDNTVLEQIAAKLELYNIPSDDKQLLLVACKELSENEQNFLLKQIIENQNNIIFFINYIKLKQRYAQSKDKKLLEELQKQERNFFYKDLVV